ncbi:distal tail protein Dit [Staphylococcus equorum]|uniref:distal tail protein Dit n=1 Tax=Staphylococcus equorum TaxID=246432 RepID=UPI003D801160
MKKEVRLFNDNFDIKLTDTANLLFLDHIEEDVEVNANTTEINGTDGVLMGPTTFGPFNLVLNFSFKGLDTKDLKLYKQKLRSILYQREPYYVWHSDMPGKKYAVYCDSNDNENLTNSFATFAVTFVVLKGYSESLFSTDRLDLMSEHWDFSNGLIVDEDIKYSHSTNDFKIYNGSSDTITPIQRHYIKIKMNIDAPNGFILKNNTNGTEFEYTKAIKAKDKLVLNGAHPFLNGKNCGIDTNWEFISLNPGMNDFKVIGDGVRVQEISFSFNFIYR